MAIYQLIQTVHQVWVMLLLQFMDAKNEWVNEQAGGLLSPFAIRVLGD